MRATVIRLLCLVALLTACTTAGPTTTAPATRPPPTTTASAAIAPRPAATSAATPAASTPRPISTPSAAGTTGTTAPALASAMLLLGTDPTLGVQAIRAVDPLTGTPIPGYEPVVASEGRTLSPALRLSRDGRKLAIAVSKGQSCEGYAGGTSCRARADILRLVDLPTWRAVTTPLPANGWAGPIAFDPKATRVALAYHTPTMTALMLFDAVTGALLAERQLSFRPTLLDFGRDGLALALYGQPVGSNPGITRPDPPRAALLDAATLDTRWEQQLPDLTSGRWCETDCYAWTPAAVLSPDRSTLYLVHADAERLTTVEFATRTVRTLASPAPSSWVDQLVARTAASTAAKEPALGASKMAVISPDGQRLYVVGTQQQSATATPATIQPAAIPLGLQVLDVISGRKVASQESEATGIAITTDGAYLLLSDMALRWTDVIATTGHTRVARLEGWAVLVGRRIDSQPIFLAYEQNKPVSRLAVLDPHTFAITHSWAPASYAAWVTGP